MIHAHKDTENVIASGLCENVLVEINCKSTIPVLTLKIIKT